MPPKKKPQVSDKNKAKAKAKSVEDKTFGLKNKNKSKKVQSQIDQIKKGADGGMAKKREAEEKRRAAEKKAAEEAKKEAMKLMGIQQPKLPFGTDPKTVVCEFFKHGMCSKGNKCKFSHDLTLGKKPIVKKDTKEEEESNANAAANAGAEVQLSKKGNVVATTEKLCVHFIEAVEDGKFGLFWKCPNGESCKYQHKLPPGMVLKTKEQKKLERIAAENAPKISLEEFIEMERDQLDKSTFTPITAESFAQWRKDQKLKKEKEEMEKKKDDKGRKLLTGKEIILQKFADKFEEEDGEEDNTINLTQFKKEEQDEGNIRDYGDGSKDWSEIDREQPAEESEKVEKKGEIAGDERAGEAQGKEIADLQEKVASVDIEA